ncbi:MAG: CHAP domain-containing protein [Actinomycetes bacterium]
MFNRKACSARHHSKRFAGLVATAVLFLGIFVSHSPLAGASSGSVICDRADYVCTTAFTSAPSYANWVKSPTGWPWSKFGAGIASLNAYGPHNCTLYAAFRLYQNGLTASPNWIGLGNATDWLKVAIANGVAHDGTPAIGSIAQWTARDGHVAYVEQINAPGYPTPNIVTTDDNYAFTYNGKPQGNDTTEQVRWPGHGWPDNFLHFKDQANGGNPGGGVSSAFAFQANTRNLYLFGNAHAGGTGQGMMDGTSPAITRLANGGFEEAFQANTGDLYIWGDAGSGSTHQGMMAGTSPSIAALPNGGFIVAFQANTGNLYAYSSVSGPANLQQGMSRGTSPSVAALSTGGYEIAFRANTGDAYLYGSRGGGSTHQGMMAGTSPSIAALPNGGFIVAFQANTGNLYAYSSVSGPANLQQGMSRGTSPSVA